MSTKHGFVGSSNLPYGSFPSEYTRAHLADVCVENGGIQTGPFGSQLHQQDYVTIGTPIITVEHLGENRIRHQDIPRVSDEDKERLSRYSLRPGDIVFSRVGSVDLRALVRKEEDGWLFSGRLLRVRPDEKIIDPAYLSWYFGLPSFREYVRKIAFGATMPSLNTKLLSDLPISFPPLAEQKIVSDILGSLDDKIELNRRMNETLEAMAQAIFKSWFVDFEPVHAKIEGRDTGLPKPLSDFFPIRLVDSERGEIPEGWTAVPLPDAVEINPQRTLRKGQVAPYLEMAKMPNRGHCPAAAIARTFGSGMRFQNGDTLVARITPCLENGKTAFVDFLKDEEVGWGSTEFIVLRPKPPLPKEYGYCLARSLEFRNFAIQSMSGSSGRQRVPAESLNHYKVALPPKDVAERFGDVVTPIFKQARAVTDESTTLAALRDALLPRLISGEIRVNGDRAEIPGAPA